MKQKNQNVGFFFSYKGFIKGRYWELAVVLGIEVDHKSMFSLSSICLCFYGFIFLCRQVPL